MKLKERTFAVGVAVGVVLGGAVVTGVFLLWPKPREVVEREPPEPTETEKRDILEFQKSRVVLQCRGVGHAIEAFTHAPANPLNEGPESLQDLVNPPFGGTGFLKNGSADLVDLWGNRVQLAFVVVGNEKKPLIFTYAPDGMPVSQYGIGSESRVPAK